MAENIAERLTPGKSVTEGLETRWSENRYWLQQIDRSCDVETREGQKLKDLDAVRSRRSGYQALKANRHCAAA